MGFGFFLLQCARNKGEDGLLCGVSARPCVGIWVGCRGNCCLLEHCLVVKTCHFTGWEEYLFSCFCNKSLNYYINIQLLYHVTEHTNATELNYPTLYSSADNCSGLSDVFCCCHVACTLI